MQTPASTDCLLSIVARTRPQESPSNEFDGSAHKVRGADFAGRPGARRAAPEHQTGEGPPHPGFAHPPPVRVMRPQGLRHLGRTTKW
jgi:hypothetical protein